MLGRKQEINLQFSQVLDMLLLLLAFVIAYQVRLSLPGFLFFAEEAITEEPSRFYWQVAIIAPFTPLVLEYFGYYDPPVHKDPWPWRSLLQMFKAALVVGVVIGMVVIFARKYAESRAVLAVHAIVGAGFLLAKEWTVRVYLRRKIQTTGWRERVVFAGSEEDVESLLRALPKGQRDEMAIVARIDLEHQPIEEFVRTLHESAVERVIVAAGHVHFAKIQELINVCEIEGIEAWLWTDFVKTSIARPTFDLLGGKPMLVFRSTPAASWSLMIKRMLDFVGAAIALIFPGLLFLLIAWIGVKLQSPGPVIFSQRRSGKNGKPFTMYKFRTMHANAEQLQQGLEEHNEMTGPVFKIHKDPRIFPFGAWMRKLSIDEWPQFWNVLRGEMSLVGPRPLPVYEVERIAEAAQRRRLSVKPGLTCLWQVSGRNKIHSFEEWVELDLRYIDNWSIWLDVAILLRTLPAVLFGSGAK
jgi:exopolysaccharide biosynthesis polyprenyl glycosylphosphotransferase